MIFLFLGIQTATPRVEECGAKKGEGERERGRGERGRGGEILALPESFLWVHLAFEEGEA